MSSSLLDFPFPGPISTLSHVRCLLRCRRRGVVERGRWRFQEFCWTPDLILRYVVKNQFTWKSKVMPAIKRDFKYKKACLKNNFKSKIKLSNATYDTSSAVRCRTLSEPFRSKDTSSRRLWRLQWTQRETKLELYIDLRKIYVIK